MTWANFYLVCFLVGFLLSLLSLLLGSLHVNFHLSHAGGPGFHFHFGDGAAHAGGHVVQGAGHAVHGPGQPAGDAAVSPINFGTMAAFLGWFGGSGYLLTRYSSLLSIAGFGLAVLFGLIGAVTVFAFLARLTKYDEDLDPLDYEMVGVLGYVSSGIRAGGTGEIIYSQQGTRHTAGARSDSGAGIVKGTEVVVTRYENGLAYVRPWEEMAGEDEQVVADGPP